MKGLRIYQIRNEIILANDNREFLVCPIPPPMGFTTMKTHEWFMEVSPTTVAVSFYSFRWVYSISYLKEDAIYLSRTIEQKEPLTSEQRLKVIKSLTSEEKLEIVKSLDLKQHFDLNYRTTLEEREKLEAKPYWDILVSILLIGIMICCLHYFSLHDCKSAIANYKMSPEYQQSLKIFLNETLKKLF